MSSNIEKHKSFLESLANSKNKMRINLINGATRDQISAICEFVFNLLKGNINISDLVKQKLKKYKKALRKLAQKSTLKIKKNILTKHNTHSLLQYLIPAGLNNEIRNEDDGGPVHSQGRKSTT